MPISKKILKNGEAKIGWRKILWYAGMFVANLVIAVLAATAVLAGGAALINMADGGGIDEIGSALVMVFAAWMSAFSVMILTMLPQVQMVIMWVLERRKIEK